MYITVLIEPGFSCIGKSLVDLKLPGSIVIALIERNNKFIIAEGATIILEGDKLYVIADNSGSLEQLYLCIGARRA